jgi:hypothetical protein
VVFFIVHVVQVVLAGWNNFRAVISGFEVVNKVMVDEVINENNKPVIETTNNDENAG